MGVSFGSVKSAQSLDMSIKYLLTLELVSIAIFIDKKYFMVIDIFPFPLIQRMSYSHYFSPKNKKYFTRIP
jgi:hypothetical protein